MAPQFLQLPSRPDLAHLKRQAKKLVRDRKAGRSDVCDVLRNLRRFRGSTDAEILAEPLALHDAQYALALAYGCGSWAELRALVESETSGKQETSTGPISGGGLWDEIDAVNDAYFRGKVPSEPLRTRGAKFIAAYQGGPGSYAGMFGPDKKTAEKGLRLFTGERVPAGQARHILGEEACRSLRLLDVKAPAVRSAMGRAESRVIAGVADDFGRKKSDYASLTRLKPGMFCCMKCSTALWRHLLARGLDKHADFLSDGLKALKSDRDGEGQWKDWPFAYTLSALIEWDMDEARRELEYAAPACERELEREFVKTNVYSQRRREVMRRALERR